ncbi:hypothetical protein L596_028471 [Steinernema carpocapsae]|uniref:Uncharacterized protein n=1 Tax=Steinernema carpocapsae TaxID=34508 RepID=A0A4U5LZG9_STECR|nr:hypothetical protein L596_028471 [Steinernema carpocapsae]
MRFAIFALLLVFCVHFSFQDASWEDEGFYPAKNDMVVGTWVSRFRRDASSSSSEESKEKNEKENEEASAVEASGSEENKSANAANPPRRPSKAPAPRNPCPFPANAANRPKSPNPRGNLWNPA